MNTKNIPNRQLTKNLLNRDASFIQFYILSVDS